MDGVVKLSYKISVSQMKMFHPDAGGCPRRWALHYLAKVPRQTTEALLDGIMSHECLDDHYKLSERDWLAKWPAEFTGTEASLVEHKRAKFAALSVAMLHYAPHSKMPPISEADYMLDIPQIDTSFYIKPDLWADREIFVDWKTTGGLNKKYVFALQQPDFWAPMPEPPKTLLFRGKRKPLRMLRDDLQARLYAHGLMQRWKTREITARWVYGSKKFKPGVTPRVWTVEHTFRRQDTAEWVEQYIWPIAQSMNTIRKAYVEKKMDTPLLVPAVPDSCEHTGHFCDAMAHCGIVNNPSPISIKHLRLPVLPA